MGVATATSDAAAAAVAAETDLMLLPIPVLSQILLQQLLENAKPCGVFGVCVCV